MLCAFAEQVRTVLMQSTARIFDLDELSLQFMEPVCPTRVLLVQRSEPAIEILLEG